MADETAIKRAARFLYDAHRSRSRFALIPDEYRPRTAGEAYGVQDEFLALLAGDGRGPIAGYKIGLTTPVMQKMMSIDEPIGGVILADTVHRSPASVRLSDFVHLAIECEIAVHLGQDLPEAGAPYARGDVAGAVAGCAAAFELVEDRGADYAKVTALALIADNSWNGGIVLGPEASGWRGLDLATLEVAMTINGQAAGGGVGGDVMGHPFEAVAWLANTLAKRGKGLRGGMVVLTGSVVATKALHSGDVARISVEGLGEAELSVA